MPIKRLAFDELLPDLPAWGETNGMAECVNLLPLDSRWLPTAKTTLYASLAAASGTIGARVNGAAYCSIRESVIFGVWDNFLGGSLYEVNDTAGGFIDDKSKGSDNSYTRGVTDLRSWSFCEFGDLFIAAGIAEPVQFIDASASRFADLFTSTLKPKAKHVCSAKTHLVLGWTEEGGTDFPRRIRWSAQGDAADMDTGSARAGFVDLTATQGEVTGLVGFEDFFLVFTQRRIIRFDWIGGEEVWESTEIGSGPDGMPELAMHSVTKAMGAVIYRSNDGYKWVVGPEIPALGQQKIRSLVRDIITDPSPPHYGSATDEISGLTVHYGSFGLELADPQFSLLIHNPVEGRFSLIDDSDVGFPVDISDPADTLDGAPVFPVFYPHAGGSAAGNDSLANIVFIFWNPTDEQFEARILDSTTYAASRQKGRLLEPVPGASSEVKRARPLVEFEEGSGKTVPNVQVDLDGWNDFAKKTQAVDITLETDTHLNNEGWLIGGGLPASANRWEFLVKVPEFDSTVDYVPINLLGLDVEFDQFAER